MLGTGEFAYSSVYDSCLTVSREHNMIRFIDGEPGAIWYSQHSRGQAFTYNAVEKHGKRPIAYSGNGTHAVYSIAGLVRLKAVAKLI